MKIGKYTFKNGLFLAPMADISDVGFRSLCLRLGADACVSEMVSAKALTYNSQKTLDLLNTAHNEKIKIVQLFGHEPEVFKQALTHKALDKFDIIDINMGCPMPKIVNNGDGSALLNNLSLAKDIISTCVKYANRPVTVKFRIGYDDNHINAVEFAKMCEEAGASAIFVHGRTKQQLYSGKVHFDVIKDVCSAVKIPVIGNGDVCSLSDYKHLLDLGCQGVMIGRASLGNPNIFAQITGKKPLNKADCILYHINYLQKFYNDSYIIKYMRKHILHYLKGEDGGAQLKCDVVKITDMDQLKDFVVKNIKK